MRKTFLPLLILIIVPLCPVAIRAQQKDAAEAELREKAFALLESLAGQVGTMQSPENRARVASNIAGSLWTHNETRARELIALVQQDISTGLQISDPDDREDFQTLMVFLRLRTDTINRIVKHDPELAYEFFKATALSPDVKLSEYAKANELALEIDLAKQVAASSPELALQIARKTLAHGFSDDLRKIFRQLNRKHKEQATALYKAIVQKIGEADLAKDWNARYFAQTLATTITPPQIDEASFSELINVFVRVANAKGCNRKMAEDDEGAQDCSMLSPLITIAAKFNPSRAAKLERWKIDDEYNYWQSSPYTEVEDVATEGSIDDVLALAGKYPNMEGEIRWRAFRKATEDGNLEKARKIAVETESKFGQQKQMLAELDSVQSQTTVDDEKLEELQKKLGEIKRTDEQAIFLASIANQLGEKDRKTAIKLLNQASQLIDTMKPGREQFAAQVGLAMCYCYHKSDRGLAMMQSLVPKLNELVDASAKLDGLERRYLRDGEWSMISEGILGDILTALAHNAGYFARCDFDRAVSMASQFERPEIRIMAQLKLAQGILAGPLKPLPFRYVERY